jgi:hypothetical protein
VATGATRRLGASDVAIFKAQAGLLDDTDLITLTCQIMVEGHGVAWSWPQAVERMAGQLASLDNPVLAARASDLRGIGRRVVAQIDPPMAAPMAAGMTPPLAAALATWLFRGSFSVEEREASGAAVVLGLAFVTEGVIPFAARDPFRVIPARMVGSALTGAISMAAGAQLKVPHGGIFVLPIPGAVTHVVAYGAAILCGTLVSAILVWMLKRRAVQPA